ncbi:amidohydrolase family protein [Stieleria sp. JC731]|uniref:amidohydrolase family protein n=1 Tax=Pirellulaceae TaxID=2691357 RepID=UPI001E50E7D5|nr:amidohydrolase family protein [Stieleria sp. JC731]MCC9604084.1 amidohydrolase family protein [Stieleria sp. JC731]
MLIAFVPLSSLLAQSVKTSAFTPVEARPTEGLRSHPLSLTCLTNATVVVRPGEISKNTSVLIQGQTIVDVANDIDIPPGAEVIDCQGKYVYAAFLDGYSEIDVPEIPNDGAKHWNGNIMPRRHAVVASQKLSQNDAYRKQGVGVRLVAPRGGIIKGTSCLVLIDQSSGGWVLVDQVAQHAQLTVPRDRRRDEYPNSPMGAVALLRQTLLDADWYETSLQARAANPRLQPLVRNDDLATLATDRKTRTFILDAPNERMAIRATEMASEFALQAILRGSGREYRDLDAIVSAGHPILVPVDFPKAPEVTSEAIADEVELRELMHWHFAPENPKRLSDAGASICLTSDGLDDPKSFLANLRTAVERGLSPDKTLAAVTTTPARLFGVDHLVGEVQSGFLANLIVADGELFDPKTKLLETWVGGKRFQHRPDVSDDPVSGLWQAKLRWDGSDVQLQMRLKQDKQKWSGQFLQVISPEEQPANEDDQSDDESDESNDDPEKSPSPQKVDMKNFVHSIDRITAWADLSKVDSRLPKGPTRVTVVSTKASDQQLPQLFVSMRLPSGDQIKPTWNRVDEPEKDGDPEKKNSGDEKEPKTFRSLSEITVNYPLGGYGVVDPIAVESAILFRGATVWTCGPQGVLESADVLVVDGKVKQVATGIKPPKGCQIINVEGKHLSPGLIDCHSHMATDGGVNESGQAVTAEVRVGDFIDNSDINIYRQLAGGLTSSNILHGSANPIGGQNQVIKLRWGDSMQDMKFAEAPAGVKFALGENVKRSNSRTPSNRYPGSRMGVPEIMRDRFLAAAEYNAAHQRYAAGRRNSLPPRVDLELEAIAEILEGERWIHCHSYRQDEIVTLLDLLDEFEITIGTLQHILEGYKVADRMLAHGAMASSFSDWWAYKFEVYDAIPDNGAIMHEVGINVSFNSDDRELARHMNTEAAKAMKYGGVSAEEALKFVTLNPAMQLRIDDHVGSLEIGKDADLVVWSGPPLSTLSRCEQTWVDGRPMFTLKQDQELRRRDQRWRSLLINYILAGDVETEDSADHEVDEEDRWLRYDEFCHAHDHDGHDHDDHDHSAHEHEEVQR